MSKYFEYFPKITYNGKTVRNIAMLTAILDDVREDPYAFLPYTVKDGETPEQIAEYYYGSVNYTWLVNLSSRVFDPYKQWPMDYEQFLEHVKRKYRDDADRTDVIAWSQDMTISDNILHYRLVEDEEIIIPPYTYLNDPNIVQGDWEAVRVFDYEEDLNEKRRTIQLLNKNYRELAASNLRDLLL